MARSDRPDGRYEWIAAFLVYLAFSFLVFGRGVPGRTGVAFIGRGSDPGMFMWYLRWWRYALGHRINPFLTDLLWAPLGFNLAWTTFIPIPAWLVMPIGHALGEAAAYNILSLIALPLAAAFTFMLCRRVGSAFWPSLLGGYIFGFSPYMLGQLLGGHLHMVFAFPIPLAILSALRRLDGDISPRRFTVEIAAILTTQFLCGIELFATMTIFGGFAILLAMVIFDRATRTRLLGLIVPLAAAYAITIAAVSPYLYYLFALGFPHTSIFSTNNFSADLAALVVPAKTVMLGTTRFATDITRTFKGDIYENGAYLGLALIVLVEVFRRRYWRDPVGKFLMILLAVFVVASMGPSLHVAGREGIWMPWAIFGRLPILSIALPGRFMMYAFLVVAIMVAMWFASWSARPLTKLATAAIVLLSIAPNLHASFWVSSLDIPAFFSGRTYASELEPRAIILPLPWGTQGDSMYWQLQSDMYFRMAGGWTGIAPFEFARMPVANYFYGGIDLPEAGDQLKAYIARFSVRAVIADPKEENFDSFKQTLDSLGVGGQNEKGVWIYKIPGDSFSAYSKLPGAQIEARANALRFDAIVEAAGKYLADGHDLPKLSPLELKRLDLLPRDWLVDAAPNAYSDWQVAPAGGDQIAIIIVGSYEGVRPLIERYRSIASEIDYPAPTRWTPDSHPALDVIKPLLVTFDSAHLAAAAQKLRDSPPPERTTPFVAGVTAGL